MNLSESSLSSLQAAIIEAASKYATGEEKAIVTDFHFQPNNNTGELNIYDDDDNVLATVTVREWIGYEDNDFNGDVEHTLGKLLSDLKHQGSFDNVSILKPYSFVLVDEDKETIAELLLVDDDTMLLNEGLLKGLDEELNAFLKDLLEK